MDDKVDDILNEMKRQIRIEILMGKTTRGRRFDAWPDRVPFLIGKAVLDEPALLKGDGYIFDLPNSVEEILQDELPQFKAHFLVVTTTDGDPAPLIRLEYLALVDHSEIESSNGI